MLRRLTHHECPPYPSPNTSGRLHRNRHATHTGLHEACGVGVQVYTEVEDWVSREKFGAMRYPSIAVTPQGRISEEICTAAANLAGQLSAKAILVYTHTGSTAGYVSRRRPDCPILAITGAPAPPRPAPPPAALLLRPSSVGTGASHGAC